MNEQREHITSMIMTALIPFYIAEHELYARGEMRNVLVKHSVELADALISELGRGKHEWIEWKDGECPVMEDAIIDVRLRDGRIYTDARHPTMWKWKDNGEATHVVAYRLTSSHSQLTR